MVREGLRNFHALFFAILQIGLLVGAAPRVGNATAGGGTTWSEHRALWVPRYNLTTPRKVRDVVSLARRTHFTALLVQVYARGEAYYPSRVAPLAPGIGDAFDPLSAVVEAAHASGLEVHAWINVYSAWSHALPSRDTLHVMRRHPEWFLADAQGRRLCDFSIQELKAAGIPGAFLSPARPEVQVYVEALVTEIAARYAVDGIHLDYFRYPSLRFGYEECSRTGFMREYYVDPRLLEEPDSTRQPGEPARTRELWNDWRTRQVSRNLYRLADLIRNRWPHVRLSCAVIADQQEARARGQDWMSWLEDGYPDFVVLMAYSRSNERVRTQLNQALGTGCRERVWAGLGAFQQSARSMASQIRIARARGVGGIAVFSYDRLAGDHRYASALAEGPFRSIPTADVRSAE